MRGSRDRHDGDNLAIDKATEMLTLLGVRAPYDLKRGLIMQFKGGNYGTIRPQSAENT